MILQLIPHAISLTIILVYVIVFILSGYEKVEGGDEGVGYRIIVPTHNEAPRIARCLASVRSDTSGPPATVHVVDDASTDGTADLVEREFPGVHLVRRPERASKADALNSMVGSLDGEVFAVVDADCTVGVGWLDGLTRELGDDTGISTGSVLVSNRRESMWTRFQSTELAFLCHQIQKPVERVGMLYSINGNNFAFTRKCWARVGGFDPAKLTEDTDFAVRARLAGVQIKSADAKVFTEVPSRLRRLLRQRRRWYLGWYQDFSSFSLVAGALFILLFYYAILFFLLTFSLLFIPYLIAFYAELAMSYRGAYGELDPLAPLTFILLAPILTSTTIITALPSALRGRDKIEFDAHW